MVFQKLRGAPQYPETEEAPQYPETEEADHSPEIWFPKIEGRPSIFGNHQRVEKMSFSRPKKAIMRPKKKVFSRNHIARYFLQKTASRLVKFGRGNSPPCAIFHLEI